MAKSIYEYVKDYGKYTFFEKKFTEVDNLVLSFLSYVDFEDIVPGINKGSIKLKDASRIYFNKYTEKHVRKFVVAVREAVQLLKEMANTRRYKDVDLFNYKYKVTRDMQFGALCIRLPDKKIFVSFEGTDGYVSGWKEDFNIAIDFPLRAHKEAIRYLNMVTHLLGPKIYVGGHSKGGNLALVAAMYSRGYVFRKIIKIYSNDGPGLREKEFKSLRYKRVKDKYVHIIPNEGFVGILFKNDDDYTVIKSNTKFLLQHDVTTWQIDKDKFVRSEMSEFTKRCRRALDTWIDNMDDKKKRKFIDNLFNIFDKAGIEDFMEVRQAKFWTLYRIYKEARNIDKDSQKLLSTCFKDLFLEWRK